MPGVSPEAFEGVTAGDLEGLGFTSVEAKGVLEKVASEGEASPQTSESESEEKDSSDSALNEGKEGSGEEVPEAEASTDDEVPEAAVVDNGDSNSEEGDEASNNN